MRLFLLLLPVIGLLMCNNAAAADPADPAVPAEPPVLHVPHFDHALPLDHAAWAEVHAHPLTLNRAETAAGQAVQEAGSFRLARGGDALFLRVDFDDHDIFTATTGDGENLYDNGDVAEWFIGLPPAPEAGGDASVLLPRRYLELHLNPAGHRSAYTIDRPGRPELLTSLPVTTELQVRRADDAGGRDDGWSGVMRLPLAAMADLLPGFDAEAPGDTPLSVLVARYNYGRFFPYRADGSSGPELSMWPAQPVTYFHLRPHHAPLVFDRPDGATRR